MLNDADFGTFLAIVGARYSDILGRNEQKSAEQNNPFFLLATVTFTRTFSPCSTVNTHLIELIKPITVVF